MATNIDGSCCFPAPSSNQVPSGKVDTWVDIPVYFVSASKPTAAVILATDIYGWEVPQMRKVADFFAHCGFLAVVPDLLKGDPVTPGGPFQDWLQRHDPAAEVPTVSQLAGHITATYGLSSFAVVGFCWGAKVAALLGATGVLQAVVLLHPSRVTVEDIRAIRAPVAVLGAEVDHLTPPSLVEEFRAALRVGPRAKGALVKVYPGVAHGWSVRYDPTDPEAMRRAQEAHQDAAAFLRTHLASAQDMANLLA